MSKPNQLPSPKRTMVLAAMGLAFDTLQQSLAQANSNTPVGLLTGVRQQITLRANDQPQDAEAFGNLVSPGGRRRRCG